MAIRKRWLRDGFTLGNLVNFGAILFACAGFYFTTTSTITDHANTIARLEKTIVGQAIEIRGLEATERAARDEVRKDLSGKLERMVDGVGLLNVKAAAQEAKLDALTKELTRVGNQLEAAIRVRR